MPGNSFANWGKVKVDHNKFVDAILKSDIHVISTARSKVKSVIEEGKGSPKKVGLDAMQQDDLPYFMDFIFNIIDRQHNCEAEKDETKLYLNKGYFVIDENVGKNIIAWLNNGSTEPPEIKQVINTSTKPAETENKFGKVNTGRFKAMVLSHPDVENKVKEAFGVTSTTQFDPAQAEDIFKMVKELKGEVA
jgi:hypothetical protein